MDRAKNITANFVRLSFSVVVISYYGAPNPPVGVYYYLGGNSVTVSCGPTPYSGPAGAQYVNTGWTGGSGNIPATGTATSYGPFAINQNCTITWTWKVQYYLTVSSAHGAPAGQAWYDSGATAHWSVTSPDSGGTGIQYVATPPTSGDVVMSAPATVTVTWTTQYYLTTSVSPGGSGTISRSPDETWYNSSAVVQLTAVANIGYVFNNWSGDLSGSVNPKTITMNAPENVTANFAPACTLTIRSQYGAPSPSVGTHTYTIGTSVTAGVGTPVYGSPGIRYLCTGWRARGSPDTLLAEGTGNSVTFTITMNTTLTWRWKTQYQLTTTVSPEGGGTINVSPTSPDGWYDAKSTVTLTAIENEGYEFSYWTGGLRGTANPQNLLLRGPRTVTANFIPE
jgi:hypothetical protein